MAGPTAISCGRTHKTEAGVTHLPQCKPTASCNRNGVTLLVSSHGHWLRLRRMPPCNSYLVWLIRTTVLSARTHEPISPFCPATGDYGPIFFGNSFPPDQRGALSALNKLCVEGRHLMRALPLLVPHGAPATAKHWPSTAINLCHGAHQVKFPEYLITGNQSDSFRARSVEFGR